MGVNFKDFTDKLIKRNVFMDAIENSKMICQITFPLDVLQTVIFNFKNCKDL